MQETAPPRLRVVFFGTPDFAEASLRALVDSSHEVVGVVTAPDRRAGRGHHLAESAVKKAAQELGLPFSQPEKLRSPDFLATLEHWKADVFCVVAFRMLPEVVWAKPPRGTVNVHGSILPDFRGAAPIQHAVAAGVTRSGVTSFFITREIDTGALLLQRSVTVSPTMTAGALYGQLMEEGAGLMVDTVDALAYGEIRGIPQGELTDGTERNAPKLSRQDGRIDWRRPSADVFNFIRGMTPFPGAWTTLNGATFKVQSTELSTADIGMPSLAPGECHTETGAWWVGTGDAPIRLVTAQLAGKPSMPAEDILRGYRYPTEALGSQGF